MLSKKNVLAKFNINTNYNMISREKINPSILSVSFEENQTMNCDLLVYGEQILLKQPVWW